MSQIKDDCWFFMSLGLTSVEKKKWHPVNWYKTCDKTVTIFKFLYRFYVFGNIRCLPNLTSNDQYQQTTVCHQTLETKDKQIYKQSGNVAEW